MISVLPLAAYHLVGDAQQVSVLFFVISVAGITSSLLFPLVIRYKGGYGAFLIGAGSMLVASALLASDQLWIFCLGMLAYVFGIAGFEVSTSLYVMHCIQRRALTRFEPIRVMAVITPLMLGPFGGVYLEKNVAHWIPFALSALFALAAIVYFRWLGLHHLKLRHGSAQTSNPAHNLQRFFVQPRLRLAWFLTLARSSWWVVFVIYTPILMESSGRGELVGAAIVSLGTAWTITIPIWGWVGRRFGVRRLYQVGFAVTAVLSFLIYWFAGLEIDLSILLIACALGSTILDGAGNVLFFRSARPYERAEMTGVFLSYRDASQLAPPGLFAIILKFSALPIVFAAAGVWLLVATYYSRYIPKRM